MVHHYLLTNGKIKENPRNLQEISGKSLEFNIKFFHYAYLEVYEWYFYKVYKKHIFVIKQIKWK